MLTCALDRESIQTNLIVLYLEAFQYGNEKFFLSVIQKNTILCIK